MRYFALLLAGIAVLLAACGDDGVTPDGAWSDCPAVASADLDAGLHVLDAESCGLTRIAEGANAYGMSWSPDGTSLAFLRHQGDVLPVSATDAESDLFLVRADGSQAIQLTDSPGIRETSPVWSPDGSTLAYGVVPASDPQGGQDLKLHVIENESTDTIALNIPCLSYEWTSAGDHLVVSGGCGYAEQFVTLVDADGGGADIVPGVRTVLAVQPGGDLVAFRCDLPDARDPSQMGLCVGRPDGSELSSPITLAAFSSGTPQSSRLSKPITAYDAMWTADGSQIAVSSGRSLFILPAGGGPGTAVDDFPFSSVLWASDDVVVTMVLHQPYTLTSYRLDTGESREALIFICGSAGGVWSPDGSQLVISTARLGVCL